jgi:hypothetical protein
MVKSGERIAPLFGRAESNLWPKRRKTGGRIPICELENPGQRRYLAGMN